MNNITEGMNIIEIIGGVLFITFVCSNIISIIKARKITSNHDGETISEFLIDFPDHNSSEKAYVEAKNKIERFITLVLSSKPAKIELNEQEINDLHTKGTGINKNSLGKHLYYKISDENVIEYLLEYPVILSSKTYRKRIKERVYFKSNRNEYTRIIEENGSTFNAKLQPISFEQSSLLLFIFNGLKSPDSFFHKCEETSDYQKAMSIVEQINSIEINNKTMVIKS